MWYQLEIEPCPRQEVEPLSQILTETGALSVTYTDKNDDPVLEPLPGTMPLWPDVIIEALYAEEHDAQEVMRYLIGQYNYLHFSIRTIADQDWERVWMNDFKPQCFGEKFWICPSWCKPPEPNAIHIILDPGLAFGTGTHPTTSLCLNWLANTDLNNKTMIDYGCGSGILGLAALKLGARMVQAVDIDEQALQATQNNALTNTIALESLQIGFPEILQPTVDLIVANILLEPLIKLQKKFKELLKDNGILVISGILDDQVKTLIDTYQTDFIHQTSISQEGWSLLIFKRA